MNGITSNDAEWLSRHTKGSWKIEHEKIVVLGNIYIDNPSLERMRLTFERVTGTFSCQNCVSLKYVEGMPTSAGRYVFENCLFPSDWYVGALTHGISVEKYVENNVLKEITAHPYLVKEHFPRIFNSHRGFASSKDIMGFVRQNNEN